jgi:hypothetical protein
VTLAALDEKAGRAAAPVGSRVRSRISIDFDSKTNEAEHTPDPFVQKGQRGSDGRWTNYFLAIEVWSVNVTEDVDAGPIQSASKPAG